MVVVGKYTSPMDPMDIEWGMLRDWFLNNMKLGVANDVNKPFESSYHDTLMIFSIGAFEQATNLGT